MATEDAVRDRTVCPACESAAKVCDADAAHWRNDKWERASAYVATAERLAAAIRAACTHTQSDAERDALVAELRESLTARVRHKSRREELLEDAAARAADMLSKP